MRASKDTIKEMKTSTEWEIIFTHHISDMGSEYIRNITYKKIFQGNNKKATQFENSQRT